MPELKYPAWSIHDALKKNRLLPGDYGNTTVVCPYCKETVLITVEMTYTLPGWACPYCGNPLETDA